MARQRSTSRAMSSASDESVSASAPRRIASASSFAARPIVPSGVPSSCAAFAAKGRERREPLVLQRHVLHLRELSLLRPQGARHLANEVDDKAGREAVGDPHADEVVRESGTLRRSAVVPTGLTGGPRVEHKEGTEGDHREREQQPSPATAEQQRSERDVDKEEDRERVGRAARKGQQPREQQNIHDQYKARPPALQRATARGEPEVGERSYCYEQREPENRQFVVLAGGETDARELA